MVQQGTVELFHSLADAIGPITDEQASEFIATWPLDAMFRELSGPSVAPATIDAACAALGKVLDTAVGASLLPGILPYASAALQSASAPLRRLAARQLGRLLTAAAWQQAADLLLQALGDSDVGVASDAEAALKQLGAPGAPQERLAALLGPPRMHTLVCSADPVLKMRALTLLVALASQSPCAAAAVQGSGLLQPLLQELQEPGDLLTCMAALQLVRDAAERCDRGMALQLQAALQPHLAALLRHPEPLLQSGALRASASLLSAALEAGEGPMAVDGAGGAAMGNGTPGAERGPAAAAAQTLFAALKGVLDVGGAAQQPAELEEAALDAVGILGLQAAGAEELLTCTARVAADVAYMALGRPASPSQRIAALHALAALAGAERSGRSGKLLPQDAEAALREAVFEGALAAWGGAGPADVMMQQLEQPFLEQRVAVYRCLSALAARDWMAGQACAHPQLLAFLLNPQSETGKQGCEWRHACVLALAATAADVMAGGIGAGGPHRAALAAAAERVQAAARGGPFGGGSSGPQEHVVATVPGA